MRVPVPAAEPMALEVFRVPTLGADRSAGTAVEVAAGEGPVVAVDS